MPVNMMKGTGKMNMFMAMKGGGGAMGMMKGGKDGGKGAEPSLNDFTPDQKVWVGNLPPGTTFKELHKHFSQFGKAKWSEVLKNGTTGGVAFQTSQQAQQAIANLNGSDLNGSLIQVDVWTGGGGGGIKPQKVGQVGVTKKQPGAKGGGAGAQAIMPMIPMGTGKQEAPDMRWKQELHEFCQKNSIEEKPVYTCEPGPAGGFMGSVTLQGEVYTSEAAASNKKAAEQGAAKVAVQALSPAQVAAVSSKAASQFAAFAGMMGGCGQVAQGTKRKREPNDDPKSVLMRNVQVLVAEQALRTATKDDITYTVEEIEGPPKTYQATVCIAEYNGGTSFSGEPMESKKQAEASAAQVAYDCMKDFFEPLVAEHAAKKKQKQKEWAEEQKLKKAEKTIN